MPGAHITKILVVAAAIFCTSPVSGVWAWLRRFIGWQVWRESQRESNVLERDFRLKRAMAFPPEVFTRGWELLRRRGGK